MPIPSRGKGGLQESRSRWMKKTAAFFAMLSQVGVVCNAGTRGFPSQAFGDLPAAKIL